MRPLYQCTPQLQRNRGNAGLWYDKFCDQWEADWSGLGDEGKSKWINTVTGSIADQNPLKKQLDDANERMTKLLQHHHQQPLLFRAESDFVTGLGRTHPVENGFAWHHTLGVPYLPGSSVKGMVRAWAEQWQDELYKDLPEDQKEQIRRIFGPRDKEVRDNDEVKASVGSVIFLDALPVETIRLKADIMTPHYSPYYQNDKANTPPADWYDPNPIPFLVVEKRCVFQFGVLPRQFTKQALEDCEQVHTWLKEALEWTGAGAKTAVGYGRFELVDALPEKLSETAKTFIEESLKRGWHYNKEAFMRDGESWTERLQSNFQSDAFKMTKALMRKHGIALPDAEA